MFKRAEIREEEILDLPWLSIETCTLHFDRIGKIRHYRSALG